MLFTAIFFTIATFAKGIEARLCHNFSVFVSVDVAEQA